MSTRQFLPDYSNEGKHLFIYSFRQTLWTVTLDETRNLLSIITADRDLNYSQVNSVLPVGNITPKELVDAIFFKPRPDGNGGHMFTGVIRRDDGDYSFQIKAGKLTLEEPIDYREGVNGVEYNVALGLPLSLFQHWEETNVKIVHALSKEDKLHVVGVDDDGENYPSYFYGVIDKESGEYDKVISFYSDFEDIKLTALHVDSTYRSVYIVGYTQELNVDSHPVPFFERLTN